MELRREREPEDEYRDVEDITVEAKDDFSSYNTNSRRYSVDDDRLVDLYGILLLTRQHTLSLDSAAVTNNVLLPFPFPSTVVTSKLSR